VLTLRSIISSCEIAESLMMLVFSAVGSALGDSESLLSRAVSRALRIGVALPAKLRAQGDGDGDVGEGTEPEAQLTPEDAAPGPEPVPPRRGGLRRHG